jgi:hypothetical protein
VAIEIFNVLLYACPQLCLETFHENVHGCDRGGTARIDADGGMEIAFSVIENVLQKTHDRSAGGTSSRFFPVHGVQ